MSAREEFARMARSMWADEKKHPLLMSILYLIALFGTLLISHLSASSAHAEPSLTARPHMAAQHLALRDGINTEF